MPSADEYDEELVLFKYGRELTTLLTELERRVCMAMIWRHKLRDASHPQIQSALHPRCSFDDREIAAELADGEDAFQRRLARRLLTEHSAEINRCPSCARIVRTPNARQCLWCGHDWH